MTSPTDNATFAPSSSAPHGSARLIAQAAARLMATKGYDATSVRDIVEACNVTKPTLYYHFKSKKGLAQALVTVPMTDLVAQVAGLVADEALRPIDKLAAVIEAQFAFCREDADRGRFVYALFFGPMGAELSAELAEFGKQLHEFMAVAVDGIAAAGLVDASRAADFLAAVRGMLTISTVDFLYREQPLDSNLAQRIVVDLLQGFSSAGPTAACATQN